MTRKLLLILLFFTGILSARAQAPVADFNANSVSGCAPLTVTFKDQSSGSPTFWNWDFGGGNLSNLQNPTMTFSTPGTYSVTLVVRNGNGTNGITKTNYITVNPSPSAWFEVDQTIGCAPSTIQFWDRSNPVAGTIVGWEWNFGDGNSSTAQNPTHQYTATGFYTVALRVTSSTGCQATVSLGRHIRIVAGVIPEFSFTTPPTCQAPFAVNFTNLTSGPGNISYQWNFGNSTGSTQESPTATYGAAGPYTVTLNAVSEYGCTGSIQKQVDISGTGTSFNSPDTVCLNTTVSFQNASSATPVSTVWDFGNGLQSTKTDDVSTYNTAGNYTVKLKNTYTNCVDSFSKPLVVLDKPVVSFTAPVTTACRGPLTVNFQDASPDAVSWQWDFGDGSPVSTAQNPSHTYTAEGSYNVTLSITTRLGCTNTLTQPAFVRIIKPTVAFGNAPNGGCISFDFTPTANVTTVDNVVSYFWEYGDGFTATTTVPTGPLHTYATAGSYTIKLTITTSGGCTESVELVNGIRTGTPPTSNFTVSSIDACASNAINFTFVSGATPVDEWLWDFGDGNTSNQQDPSHIYADSGYYNVTVTAYNNKCPTVSTAQTVHIKPPIANFSYAVNCANGSQVTFTNTSKVNEAVYGVTAYTWDFGDGSPTSNVSNPLHTYATSTGTFTVTLTATAGGCAHSYSEQIELVNIVADFSVSDPTVCKNETVMIAAINSDPAKIAQYEWSWSGNPFNPGERSFGISFATTGTHAIGLRITDINGCTSVKTDNNAITVTGPTANFTPQQQGGCTNTSITFNDLSTPAANLQSWAFDFGDGNSQTFTSAPFRHTYADTGSFVVKMTVSDDNGCTDTYTATDTVFITKPVAGFSSDYTTICPQTDLTFKDTSSGRSITWSWDFGDGNMSIDQSPTHQYTAMNGTYSVKLVVTDAFGCKDSAIKTNYITVKKPVPAFTVRDTSSICPLLETKFTFQGSDYESFYWDFGDGSISTLTNPNHFYNTYGSYEAKLYVIGYGGCIDSVSDTINVYNPYTVSNMTYNPINNCNSLLVDFSLETPPSTRFVFYYGDGGVSYDQTKMFQHFYKEPGFYAPAMLLQDSLGCQVTIGGPNTIRVIGALPLFGVDKKEFCDQGTVNFTNYTIGNDPVVSRTWDFDDGTTSTDTDPTHTFTRPGTFVVKHNVTTQTGCANAITDTIRIYGTPQPLIVSDTVVCINDVLPLQASLIVPDTAISWKWNLGSNGQSTNEDVSVKYPQSGNYTVSLEAANKLGCKADTSKNIFVPPTPVVTVNGNITLPVGTGIALPVTYSPNVVGYTWTPPAGLSCTDCATPIANPKFTTQYTVRAEDIYGCSATQNVTVNVVCNEKNYFVPNTFSPNNDGKNDVFMPRGSSIARVNRMQVFNRWGEVVFEKRNFMTNDASAGWDGTYKGKPANSDVYIYVIEFVCENAAVVPFRGNVTLIR